jgi:hypothetical protein
MWPSKVGLGAMLNALFVPRQGVCVIYTVSRETAMWQQGVAMALHIVIKLKN